MNNNPIQPVLFAPQLPEVGKRDFKSCLHSFPKMMVRICFALDVGTSKDVIFKHVTDEIIRNAINYYIENLDEARDILLPYTIATEQYPYER